jgi:Domain of unknown function (DUF5671)
MADTRLHSFIDAALRAGKSRDEIGAALAAAGWSREQVGDGMKFFADVPFPVPVPRPRAQLSARDAFFYLLMFGALYISAYQLASLLFSLINLALPAGLNEYVLTGAESATRWATASLIVAFPLFLWVGFKLNREVAADPTRRQSAVRRWLTHLTLLGGAGFIVGDSITLLYNLLSGDLTMRFVLKVLVVAVIAGSIFAYYLHSTRQDSEAS